MKNTAIYIGLCACLNISQFANAQTDFYERKFDDTQEQKMIDFLNNIVSRDTVIGRDKTAEMAEFLKDALLASGFQQDEIKIIAKDAATMLIARYPGSGVKRPMIIATHMDVVEAKQLDWSHDPFKMVKENGFFFGRGVLDNKIDLTGSLQSILQLRKENFKPSRDIILIITGDEETGMAHSKYLSTQFPDAEFLLNGDGGGGELDFTDGARPFLYHLETAEKTYVDFDLTVTNPGGHSSVPKPTNAIYELAKAVYLFSEYQFPVRLLEQTQSYFQEMGKQIGGNLGAAMVSFSENPHDSQAIAVIREYPPYAAYLSTTCVATQLEGGHAVNALAQSASANINCRILPDESVESVREQIIKIIDNPDIKVTQKREAIIGGASALHPDVLNALRKAVDFNYPNTQIVQTLALGASDSMYFRVAGIPSFGVSGVYIKATDHFGHGLDERIPVANIKQNLAHWSILIQELAK